MSVATHPSAGDLDESARDRAVRRAMAARDIPQPRTPKLSFDGLPRRWWDGSVAATHMANSINLLFPAGERFFIRSVRHYLDRVSPELQAQVKGFFGQEGRHANAHERLFDTLRQQGFDIDPILERYEYVAYGWIERLSPPAVNLACTAALEHFTAIMAADALETNELAEAHPELRRLLEWHAVEELEHKAVAFDVLKEVAPSYALRIFGVLFATCTLGGFWFWAFSRFLEQDGSSLRRALKELSRMRDSATTEDQRRARESVLKRVFARGIRAYLRRDFHPNDVDHSALIKRTLDRLAAEGVVTAKPAS